MSYTIVVAAISSELPPNEATFKGLRSRLMEYAATDEAYNVVTEAEDAAAEKLREYAYPDAEIPRSVAALALGTTEGAILGWKRGRIAAGSVRYRRRANVKCVTAKAIFNGAIWCRPMLISGKYREVTTQWDMLRSRVLDTQAPQDQ